VYWNKKLKCRDFTSRPAIGNNATIMPQRLRGSAKILCHVFPPDHAVRPASGYCFGEVGKMEKRDAADLDAELLAIREMMEKSDTPASAERAGASSHKAVPLPDDAPVDAFEDSEAPDDALAAAIRETVTGPAEPAAGPMQDLPAREIDEDLLTEQIRAAEAAVESMAPDAGSARHVKGQATPGPVARALSHLTGHARGYRPTPRHIAFAIIVLLAVLRPWLVVALILLPIVIVTGIFLAVGYDRFWSGVLRSYQWYHARRPKRAERLRRRADSFAMRWDAFLDRFHEGSVDALYLPDLNSLQQEEERHEKALDQRFSKLHDEAQAR
jgi:hypothetical protein